MDLRNLIERGFSTARLCAGGHQESQDAKWLANRHQEVLLAVARSFTGAAARIDADPDLSDEGKARRRQQLAEQTMKDIEAESAKLRALIAQKRDLAHKELAEAVRPAGESDGDRIVRELRLQNIQRHLLAMDGQGLLSQFAQAVKTGDAMIYDAVTTIPEFILRDKGFASETLAAARREWASRVAPAAARGVEDGDTMAQLAEQNFNEAARAIREFAGLPEPRRVTSL